mgnify:CR=1 FL=1
MKRRVIRVFTSAVLTGTMVLTMGGMTAQAEVVDQIDLKKVVTTDGDTYAPNTAFEFKINNGTGNGSTKIGDQTVVVRPGVDGGLVLADYNDFTYSPTKMDAVAASYTIEGKIIVDIEKFDAPGVYHYTVNEVEPDKKYDGILYDTKVRNVYVYIENKEHGGGFECKYVKTVKEGETEKSDLTFTNNYGQGDGENDTTHDIKITKTVSGNQGDKEKAFTFSAMVKGSDDGEFYKVVMDQKGGTNTEAFDHLESGISKTFTLKDGESIHIYGLTQGDIYTISETDYSSDGYVTTFDGKPIEVSEGKVTKEGNVTADDSTVEVENNKTVSTPTGLALSFGPYALMVALAGAFAALFLRKKREQEEL